MGLPVQDRAQPTTQRGIWAFEPPFGRLEIINLVGTVCLGFHADFNVNVRPAALEAAATIAAGVVGLDSQRVIPCCAEGSVSRSFSIFRGNRRTIFFERDGARTSEHAPDYVCGWALAWPRFRRNFAVVRNPHRERKGFTNFGGVSLGDTAWGPSEYGSSRLKTHNRWSIPNTGIFERRHDPLGIQ